MSDEPETAQAAGGDGEAAAQPALTINAQYVKDLSFEVPSAPQVFGQMQRGKPDMQVKVDVQARTLQEHVYEVILHIEAKCLTSEETTAFLCDLVYGGVFTTNVPETALRPVLLIECPRLLFPFARQIIASVTLDGGFMPLMLAPVDFAGLYQQQLQRQQQQPVVQA